MTKTGLISLDALKKVCKQFRKNCSLSYYSGCTFGAWQAMFFKRFTLNSIHSIQKRQESARNWEKSAKMTEDSRVKQEKEIELISQARCSKKEIDWCTIWKFTFCWSIIWFIKLYRMNFFSKSRQTNWIYSRSSFTRSFLAESLCTEPDTRQGDQIQFSLEKSIQKKEKWIHHLPTYQTS